MKFNRPLTLFRALSCLCAVVPPLAAESDWPQWHGPTRDAISTDKGLLKTWPEAGPQRLWQVTHLGEGFGSISMVGDRLFVQGTKDGKSVLFCLKRFDGSVLWIAELGPRLEQDKGAGPRSTPTVEGELLWALTENGDLACLKVADGSVVWKKNFVEEFKSQMPGWHFSESPLIDGDRLIVSPGGKEAGIVALDKKTGGLLWACKELSDMASYASCILADVGGIPTIMNFTGVAAVGVRATDGKLMWSYGMAANNTANCTSGVFSNGRVFFTSNYNTGGGLLKLRAENGEVKSEEVYFEKQFDNHHGGVVLVDGHLYGFAGQALSCMEFETGKIKWTHRSVGKGSLTTADGLLFLLSEGNTVGLADVNPAEYVEKGRFRIEDQGRESWAHPVVCGGKLYIRNWGMLACHDVRAH